MKAGLIGLFIFSAAVNVAQAPSSNVKRVDQDTRPKLLRMFVGHWKGTCRTWFEPDKLADESEVSGQFTEVLGGKFVRHVYKGQILEHERNGEELIGYNSLLKSFEVSWIDDFHMSTGIMFSTGKGTTGGFSVTGTYQTGEKEPKWSWRTEYKFVDKDHLTIKAYNITPAGQDYKAVELNYVRQK